MGHYETKTEYVICPYCNCGELSNGETCPNCGGNYATTFTREVQVYVEDDED